jgi:polyphosphate kinase
MTRNIDTRVEVGFPIYDEDLKKEIRDIINLQLDDNTKSREINASNTNKYHKTRSELPHRAQIDIYDYLKHKVK